MAEEKFSPTRNSELSTPNAPVLPDGYITQNFQFREFRCKHCGMNEIQKSFVVQLQKAREIAGIPFFINSGYRCPEYNQKFIDQGESIEKSAHTKGLAADIAAIASATRWKIIIALFGAGFSRIGIGTSFIHVDADTEKPQEVAWTYPHNIRRS